MKTPDNPDSGVRKRREFWIDKALLNDMWDRGFICDETDDREENRFEYIHVIERLTCDRDLEAQLKEKDERIAELEKVDKMYRELCHEWTETCSDGCNSWGHDDNCKNIYLAEVKRGMLKQIATLKADNEKLRECVEIAKGQLQSIWSLHADNQLKAYIDETFGKIESLRKQEKGHL